MQPSSDLSDVMTETAHTRAEHKPRPLIDLAVSILIPSLILMKLSGEDRLGADGALLLALAFPLVATNNYHLSVMTLAFIFAIAAMGLNLITGYTGRFNLAHGGFMAIGAYTVGILTVDHQWPFWPAFLAAGAVTGFIGWGVGLLSLRLKGHYFSIFTLCVGYIIYLLIESGRA